MSLCLFVFLRDLEDLTSLIICLPFVTVLEMRDGMAWEEGVLALPCVVVGLPLRREEEGEAWLGRLLEEEGGLVLAEGGGVVIVGR